MTLEETHLVRRAGLFGDMLAPALLERQIAAHLSVNGCDLDIVSDVEPARRERFLSMVEMEDWERTDQRESLVDRIKARLSAWQAL